MTHWRNSTMKLKYTYSPFSAWSQGLWSMTLPDSYSGTSESCIDKGWFSVVSIEKLVGMNSSIKCSTCYSSTIGSDGPSQIGHLDSMVVGWTNEMRELVLGEALSSTRTPRPPRLGGLRPPLLPLWVICKWNLLHIQHVRN